MRRIVTPSVRWAGAVGGSRLAGRGIEQPARLALDRPGVGGRRVAEPSGVGRPRHRGADPAGHRRRREQADKAEQTLLDDERAHDARSTRIPWDGEAGGLTATQYVRPLRCGDQAATPVATDPPHVPASIRVLPRSEDSERTSRPTSDRVAIRMEGVAGQSRIGPRHRPTIPAPAGRAGSMPPTAFARLAPETARGRRKEAKQTIPASRRNSDDPRGFLASPHTSGSRAS